MFKRIDQVSLSRVGLGNKSVVSETAIQDVHAYSMLQRFRANKDLSAADSSKPEAFSRTAALNQDIESDSEDDDLENLNRCNVPAKENNEVKWWLEEDAQAAKRAITVKKENA
jgi:hypothetical protein